MKSIVRITPQIAAEIKALLASGQYFQHEIAALYHINQGRVSEINTGKRFAKVPVKKP